MSSGSSQILSLPVEGQIALNSEQALVWQTWKSGPHSNTYELGKGPNTYCARCHSPMNWDPSSTIDESSDCLNCKFDSETDLRTAISNQLVLERDWENIGCEICHLTRDHTFLVAWFNVSTADYEEVASPKELCEKCHRDTDTLRHERNLGKDLHPDFDCTDCHDAHSTTTSCSDAACHAGVLVNSPFILGHDAAHTDVVCVACHDSTDLEVGLMDDGNTWALFRTTEPMGNPIRKLYQSHYLQREVDCDRCHYKNNPWGLKDL
jgi:hypothetical protein